MQSEEGLVYLYFLITETQDVSSHIQNIELSENYFIYLGHFQVYSRDRGPSMVFQGPLLEL